ncbi:MAG: hypothetical protein HOP29_08180 [Phycisphaerales bacterium]|nr:hypothetical protein [Phycisphaerales bacterium]
MNAASTKPGRRSTGATKPNAHGPVCFVAGILFATWAVYAPAAQDRPPNVGGDCAACHSCDDPSPQARCLRACARPAHEPKPTSLTNEFAPHIVILGELADRYLPVPFDHAGHAAMANMTRGCVVCHHHTPQGQEHPSCKSCHALEPGTGDIHMPGLKGAYHRQCMNCHVEWSGDTHCSVCHQPRTGGTTSLKLSTPSKDDIIGQMHPPIPEPEVRQYEIARDGIEPSRVLFRHKRHIDAYGLRCADCHHENSCVRCHARSNSDAPPVKPLNEHHQPCFACHENDACESCHYETEQPPPAMFDHAGTRWPLTRYHREAGCRDCHTVVPYQSPKTECNECHNDWAPGTFDHAVTGQTLDALHVSIDCAECHTNRQFDRPPTCGACHDADSGISFPDRRPGPVNSNNP